jgi:hypothetical protein
MTRSRPMLRAFATLEAEGWRIEFRNLRIKALD